MIDNGGPNKVLRYSLIKGNRQQRQQLKRTMSIAANARAKRNGAAKHDCPVLALYPKVGLEQLVGIFTSIYQCLNLLYSAGTVSSVCYTEPLSCSVENFTSSLTAIDECVYYERNEEL